MGASVVAIHGRRRIPSSGVVWQEGVVATASHTIEREGELKVTLEGGGSATGRLAGRDPSTDLAVLRLEGGSAPAAALAPADALAVGRLVLALGRPWDAGVTATLGMVAALGGEWRTWSGGLIDRLVRLDLPIRDGFSGGPLVDAGGGVLGVNTSALLRGEALTVPSATVDRVVAQLLEHGHVRRGYVGVAMQRVRLRGDSGAEGPGKGGVGMMIVNVEPDGPAGRAGLLLGDVLLEVDGRRVRDVRHVAAALGALEVGRTVDVTVIRAGERRVVPVEVGLYPHARDE